MPGRIILDGKSYDDPMYKPPPAQNNPKPPTLPQAPAGTPGGALGWNGNVGTTGNPGTSSDTTAAQNGVVGLDGGDAGNITLNVAIVDADTGDPDWLSAKGGNGGPGGDASTPGGDGQMGGDG